MSSAIEMYDSAIEMYDNLRTRMKPYGQVGMNGKKWVGILVEEGIIDIIKVGVLGPGRFATDQEYSMIAVAKVYPAVKAMRLVDNGQITLCRLVEVIHPAHGDVYGHVFPESAWDLGVLSYYTRCHAISDIKAKYMCRVTKDEAKGLMALLP